MKRLWLVFLFPGLFLYTSYGQTQFYGSGGSEMIFSLATIDNQGESTGNVLRWAPVFNLQGFANLDLSNTVGFFAGLGFRNVGFIYNMPNSSITMKYRTYNLGIPVGVKLGKLDFMFLFAGYEIEFPFHYKEKKFENEKKDKFTVWFSNRVEPVQHALFAGLQFPHGLDVKFKYYLTNFHNLNYVEIVDNEETKPYEFLRTNIFYFSLSWNLFTNMRSYAKKKSYETVKR